MSSMRMMKTFRKRWILLNACSVGVGILFVREFIRGALSPRGFGIAGLILGLAYCTAVALTIKKSAKEFTASLGPSAPSIDEATRTLFLRRIRRAKTNIAFLTVVLVLALIQIRNFPPLALLVGGALNLLTSAHEVRTIIRLKRVLNSGRISPASYVSH